MNPIISGLKNQFNVEKFSTIAGSLFLVFIITFTLYTVIRKNQQVQLQSAAQIFLKKSISSITKNWNYHENKLLFSNKLIKNIEENNSNIFKNFSRLGKLLPNEKSNEKLILLNYNPAPDNNSLSITVSYEVMATFENGSAIFIFNLLDQKDTPVIDFINVDAVYNINTSLNSNV